MKKMLFFVFLLLPCWLSAQSVDSVALRHVDSLIQVSRDLTGQREFDKAIEVNAAAEKIALEKLGRESVAYGNCCFNRGRVNYFKRDYSETEKWYLEALAIREKAVGRQHLYYVKMLNTLASLYASMDNLEKAELLYLEVLAIQKKVQGNGHPDCASSMYALGIIYERLGNLEKAEQLYLESKTIREKTLGKEHQDYSNSLHNLALFYTETGNLEKAESFYLEVIALCEKTLGKEHYNYSVYIDGLAHLYHEMGDYEKVEPLYLESIAICEKPQWNDYPCAALSMANLATHYFNLGNLEKAEPLYFEALALLKKQVGNENAYYTAALKELATLYFNIGNYEKAEPYYMEENLIQKKVLGVTNSEYASSLRNLANLYAAMGNYAKAEPLYTECTLMNQSRLEKAVRHLSERELGNYLIEFSESQDQVLSFVQLSASQKVTAACFDNALFYKGFLLQTAGQIRRMSFSNPVAHENFNLLKSYERQLAAQYAQPIVERDSIAVAKLETQANDLEKELTRTVAGFGLALRQVKWQEVQAALKPGEAAVEFVNYRFYQKKQTDRVFYTALVLLPGTDSPKSISLFEEKQLATLLKTGSKPQPAVYNNLYAAGKTGDQLYDLIWKPVVAALPEGTTIYCSPSGLLHRINLAAIPTPEGKTLAEKHHLTSVGSTRSLAEGTKAGQLVVPSPVFAANQNATAQLYGGIQYDVTNVVAAHTETRHDDLAARRGPDFTQNDSTLRGENWNYLRWTEVEITAAAEVMNGKGFSATVIKGADATEESFKEMGEGSPSPRILHVATHGFFFPDPQGEQALDEKTFKVSEHPMIRSGLVLAGGNYAWKTGKPLRPELEDGILTAYEISQMNLSNTELAVLSACETGLGDLVGNEGVYGLQRAFKIAGVRYLIMSLWQVPDFQTQVFMTAFYKHWLTDEKSVPEAFRATQSELKAKYSEAFKWAGFVLVE